MVRRWQIMGDTVNDTFSSLGGWTVSSGSVSASGGNAVPDSPTTNQTCAIVENPNPSIGTAMGGCMKVYVVGGDNSNGYASVGGHTMQYGYFGFGPGTIDHYLYNTGSWPSVSRTNGYLTMLMCNGNETWNQYTEFGADTDFEDSFLPNATRLKIGWKTPPSPTSRSAAIQWTPLSGGNMAADSAALSSYAIVKTSSMFIPHAPGMIGGG